MSKALSDCLPRIIAAIQVQSQGLASNTSHAVSSSSLASILKLQPTNSNTQPPLQVTSLFALIQTQFLETHLQLLHSVPVNENWGQCHLVFSHHFQFGPLVGRDFIIGPAYSPIPNKLVSKIISSQFVKLADLPPDNLKINETETQMFLDGKLVVTLARRRTMEIQHLGQSIHHLLACSLCLTAIEMGTPVTA